MTERSPFEYTDEQMAELVEEIDELETVVVDGTIMVTADVVYMIAGILIGNMKALAKADSLCEAEAFHTMITADYILKIAGTLKLKHADAIVPDNINELLEIPEE